VLAIVVVGGGVAFFLLKGGNDGGTGPDDKPSDLASPSIGPNADPVHFSLRKTQTIETVAKGKLDKSAVKDTAKDIRDTLANMYTAAYTDPDHWKSSDYDAVFGFFATGKPAAAAKRDVKTLTLGPNAGDTYDEVKFRYGGLKVEVLTDKGGVPYTVAATADFTADATTKDGSDMLIKSHATYYLQNGEGGWTIVAYKAKRADEKGENQ
jgi:hypothetical protein